MFGPETQKAHERRKREGFYEKFCQGSGLDIGHSGSDDSSPITNSIGVDIGFPGYDGLRLPFPDESQNFVYSSHCLEHIENYKEALVEWWRVLKFGGHLIITVPHKFLYEKKANPPSNWNSDHKRFYTPASLMKEIEESLIPNNYRVIYLKDCSEGFDYELSATKHSCGEYQIEVVLQKIQPPIWGIV